MALAKISSLGMRISLILAISTPARASLIPRTNGDLISRATQPVVNANCGSQFSWMNNAKAQSPCVVAAWVEESCSSTSMFVLSRVLTADS